MHVCYSLTVRSSKQNNTHSPPPTGLFVHVLYLVSDLLFDALTLFAFVLSCFRLQILRTQIKDCTKSGFFCRPQTKFGVRYFFTSVCHSFCPQGEGLAALGGSNSRGVMHPGGLHPGGSASGWVGQTPSRYIIRQISLKIDSCVTMNFKNMWRRDVYRIPEN